MLDLIIFSFAIAATKYIGQKNPLLSSPSPSPSPASGDPSTPINDHHHHAVSRYIFHSCLLLSLLLFSLSILEAAPIAWLVVIDRASLFVVWYRALLWALCVLLLVVHPSFLGAMVGASIFDGSSSLSSATSNNNTKANSSTMPSSPSR
mmetsp:Transcript_9790/g.21173  ORF Transcript_9790/g.21173 Transcript_9790/m.21173 type:complete len:149 (+) Transcript_9790:91-537(+)